MKIQKPTEMSGVIDGTISVELGELSDLKGKHFIPILPNNKLSVFPLIPLYREEEVMSIRFFNKIDVSDKDILAIDSSIIPVAESIDGIVFGVRGCVVRASNQGKAVYVDGPRLIYVDKESIRRILKYTVFRRFNGRALLHRSSLIKRIILALYELGLLEYAVDVLKDGYIVIDGSLEFSLLSMDMVNSVFKKAESSQVSLIGVSKRSRLVRRYAGLLSYLYGVGVDAAVPLGNRSSSVELYVGFLRIKSGYPFRLDILDLAGDALDVLYSLPSNSIGYPSLLVEAHTVAKLRSIDLVNLLRMLVSRGGKVVMSLPYRSHVLGALEADRDEGI